ncbi:hypothetical protein AEQU3_01659 [Aequorivita antarctica]|nr:hypothetical protein AEQU3_01659 [Aequorivita antarctica]
MFLQLAFILILISSIIGLMVWFFKERWFIVHSHNQNLMALENAISSNRCQINFRNTNLKNYDFLKFNLGEALIIQKEIQL